MYGNFPVNFIYNYNIPFFHPFFIFIHILHVLTFTLYKYVLFIISKASVVLLFL